MIDDFDKAPPPPAPRPRRAEGDHAAEPPTPPVPLPPPPPVTRTWAVGEEADREVQRRVNAMHAADRRARQAKERQQQPAPPPEIDRLERVMQDLAAIRKVRSAESFVRVEQMDRELDAYRASGAPAERARQDAQHRARLRGGR